MVTNKLSVIIPAFNEEQFIGALLEKALAVDLSQFNLGKEIIVIDDCSKDRTAEIVRQFPEVILLSQSPNQGKGAAVRAGIARATGDYLIIQVYGSRYLKHPTRGKLVNLLTGKHARQSWPAYLGGQSLSFASLICTGNYLTDTVTALKLFRREIIKSLELRTSGFELDHEISAKVLAQGCQIKEVPISYFPRSKEEGKKIGARDWFVALKTFYRFRNG